MEPNIIAFTDALTLLEKLENESIDLVYLDPPWFLLNNKKNKNSDKNEYIDFIYKVLQQARRVLKSTGNLVLFTEPTVTISLQQLVTRLFGAENFVSEFIIPHHSPSVNSNFRHKHLSVIFLKNQMNIILILKPQCLMKRLKIYFLMLKIKGVIALHQYFINWIKKKDQVYILNGKV